MAGEGELVIVRGDARNKAGHADRQKHRADCKGSFLDGCPKLRGGFGRWCRMRCALMVSSSGSPTVLHVVEANGS
jgi:hypothetical protein